MATTINSNVSRFHAGARCVAIAAGLLLVAANAFAEAEVRNGQDWVRITSKPCTTAAVLERVPSDETLELRQAEAEFQGVRYAPCWAPTGNAVHLLYEDGDEGVLPVSTWRQVVFI